MSMIPFDADVLILTLFRATDAQRNTIYRLLLNSHVPYSDAATAAAEAFRRINDALESDIKFKGVG